MLAGTANSSSVAEHALFLMLTLAKRGGELDVLVRAGRWAERMTAVPVDLLGKTVLVVGFGRTGTRVAKRCLAMEMTVIVYDPYLPAENIRAAGCEPVSDLDAALPRADFVTIHCPRSAETIGMFGAARLQRMKKTAFLVNTARGGIVDEGALHTALTAGTFAGAGIDVFDPEPPPLDHPLLQLTNLVTSLGHQCDYERLRYCLALPNENRPVHVCHRARSPGDEPMAVRLPHGIQDALRYASRSHNTGLDSGIGSNSFDHCGAFGDALRFLSHCFPCDSNECEQQ